MWIQAKIFQKKDPKLKLQKPHVGACFISSSAETWQLPPRSMPIAQYSAGSTMQVPDVCHMIYDKFL